MDVLVLARAGNRPGEIEAVVGKSQPGLVAVVNALMRLQGYQVGRAGVMRDAQVEQPDGSLGTATLVGERDTIVEETPAKDVAKGNRAGSRCPLNAT